MTSDVFGTTALRDAVLGAWQASPARLREDANHEEDHARGYYRDRVVIELAQNAADAATRAGVPGRLLLRLTTGPHAVLVAANTGTPLDAAGVASLASLRASAKRGSSAASGVVGRFGVGFAAVRAVADEIAVVSTSGAVQFSLARSLAELARLTSADVPPGASTARRDALAQEVAHRDGSLPVLRLPFAHTGHPPEGYTTAVVLSLRDHAAVQHVTAQLLSVGDALLLALPGLTEVLVEIDDAPVRRIADVEDRWRVVRGAGEVPLALVADRPVEERSQRRWEVTWALPLDGDEPPSWSHVVHAPTPSDEPCTLPALLVATLPLDPTRRHVAMGALAEAVIARAAEVYGTLAAEVAADERGDPLALVPTGLASGAVDGALRDEIVEVLRRTPMLRPASGGELLEPDRAVAVAGPVGQDPRAVAALATWGTGLVVLPPGREAAARTVAVELHDLAEVVEGLPLGGDPAHWRELYAALEPSATDAEVREQLAALPVLLSDGRTVRGARGLVAWDASAGPAGSEVLAGVDVLSRWGLRVVDPGAMHPLLERLGVQVSDAGSLLASDQVRQAVLDCADDDDLEVVDAVTEAVLGLLGAALADGRVPASARSWLGLLTLRADDGEPAPAHGLVVAGSPAAEVLDDRVLAAVDPALVRRWGSEVLAAAGVRLDLAVTIVPDVVADPDAVDLSGGDLEGGSDDPGVLAAQLLDGWEEYLELLVEVLGAGTYVGEVPAVADLDAVRDDAWPQVLARLTDEPELRRALLAPPAGVASYTAWWLRTRSGLGLDRPFGCSDADPVVRLLLPPAPAVLAGADDDVQRALGGLLRLGDLDAHGWESVLDRLGEIDRTDGIDRAADADGSGAVAPEVAVAVWQGLAAAARAGVDLADAVTSLPCLRPADDGLAVRMTPVEDAAVLASPMWAQRTDVAGLVPCPPAVAEVLAQALDLPLVDELAEGAVGASDEARRGPVPDGVRDLLGRCPETWYEHDDLTVDGVAVAWWVEGDGPDAVIHAGHLAGLARGLAQASGRWDLRHAVDVLLAAPERRTELVLEQATDDLA
ncbi:sacsin N-terminal ATP-binding-like domain-containing protein [Cellulomonas sp. P24]|uniref:sacsin N-terminal ATP-binding-like domain-containing protein n=1 Tax=Cellulomonas sp. P24 TaxID=2885206 RepID=UPI00216B4A03|nr:ATP-binding protein [Cellulomonas sp. P24]MCR6493431.1 hypothetical protein [Cellulomonas sp. P24]